AVHIRIVAVAVLGEPHRDAAARPHELSFVDGVEHRYLLAASDGCSRNQLSYRGDVSHGRQFAGGLTAWAPVTVASSLGSISFCMGSPLPDARAAAMPVLDGVAVGRRIVAAEIRAPTARRRSRLGTGVPASRRHRATAQRLAQLRSVSRTARGSLPRP